MRRRWGLLGVLAGWALLGLPVRAAGPVQFFNTTPDAAVTDEADLGSPTAAPTIRLVGPRNGFCSGKVVVRAAGPLKGLRAAAGALRQEGGAGAIAAVDVRVRYAHKEGPRVNGRGGHGEVFYDDLMDEPPAAAATLPVWVTIRVPAAAAAGEYRGTLTVTPPAGKPVAVGLRLTVCPWKAPDPRDFVSHVGLVQSPESLALKYQVPCWSDRHFELIGQSFRLMGQVGNKVLSVTVIAETQLGNTQSMIRLRAAGSGKYEVDFSVMDRYLDLYEKLVGRPEVVYFYVWDNGFEHARYRKLSPFPVTVVDPATGRLSRKEFTLQTPEAEAFFKEVLDGVRARFKKRGWKEENILLGIASDAWPSKETTDMFRHAAPYARWASNSHNYAARVNDAPVGYNAFVRAGPKKEGLGWRNPRLVTVFPRDKGDWHPGPARWRYLVEEKLTWGYRGIGRIGADFWPVKLPGSGRLGEMDNTLRSRWTGNLVLGVVTSHLLAPGPDGAAATARYEMLREGIQEAEARVAIEKALVDDAARARLGEALARRCRKLLDERRKTFEKNKGYVTGLPWQDMSARLFAMAGEVRQALAGN